MSSRCDIEIPKLGIQLEFPFKKFMCKDLINTLWLVSGWYIWGSCNWDVIPERTRLIWNSNKWARGLLRSEQWFVLIKFHWHFAVLIMSWYPKKRIEVKIGFQMIHIFIIVWNTPTVALTGSQSLINQPTWWCIEWYFRWTTLRQLIAWAHLWPRTIEYTIFFN